MSTLTVCECWLEIVEGSTPPGHPSAEGRVLAEVLPVVQASVLFTPYNQCWEAAAVYHGGGRP